MKKKKRIITIAGLLLISVIGATFAYYTSNTTFENVFNAGKYKVTLTEVFESPDNWVPGETVPKTVTAKNDGTVPAAVRISYTEQWLQEIDGVETDITSQVTPNPAIINFANTNDWTLSNGYYYYKYILEPTDETSSFISGVTLDPNLDSVTCTGEGNEKTCEAQNPASGAKYKLTFTIQTVQYDQYENVWNTNVEITEKPNVIAYLTRQVEGQITPGDVIGIGETEDFYVISSDSEKTVLLAKYNLMVGNYSYYNDEEETYEQRLVSQNTPGYGLQSEDAVGGYAREITGGTVSFSSTNYWDSGTPGHPNLVSPYNANGASYNGNPYPYVYDNTYVTAPDFMDCGNEDDYDNHEDYEACVNTHNFYTPGYSIAYYVEQYKTRLIEMGAPSTITGRLLSYEEFINEQNESALCNGQDYWLGSGAAALWWQSTGRFVWVVTSDNESVGYFDDFAYDDDFEFGVRPVIEISTSELQ